MERMTISIGLYLAIILFSISFTFVMTLSVFCSGQKERDAKILELMEESSKKDNVIRLKQAELDIAKRKIRQLERVKT